MSKARYIRHFFSGSGQTQWPKVSLLVLSAVLGLATLAWATRENRLADFEAYTTTRILGNHGNVTAWEAVEGILRITTSEWFGVEQHALTRTDLSLEVGEEWKATLSRDETGEGDFGLYVGARPPVAGEREDFISVYLRHDGLLLSRGADGSEALDLINGGRVGSLHALFIARLAEAVFEVGWYEGTVRRVLVVRTMSNRSLGHAIGFYASVLGEGILGSATHAELIPASIQLSPRLLIDAEEVTLLREKVGAGWMGEAMGLLRGYADEALASGYEMPYSATFGRRIHRRVSRLALAGLIDQDERYLDHAVGFLLHQLRTHDLQSFESANAGSPQLSLGDTVHALAIGYDWLSAHMTPGQRVEMGAALETFGARLYEISRARHPVPNVFNDSTNHNSVANGALGLAALALEGKEAWLEQATRQVRAYLEHSSDADGWNFEGRGYWRYGAWGAITFADALHKLGGADLMGEQPKYANVAFDYFVRQMPPYVGEGNPMAGTMYMISRYQDRVGLWGWLETMGRDGDGTFGAHRWDDNLAYVLIWGDPDLEPLHPAQAELPLDKFYPSDRALLRDGWGEHDSVVTFTSGWTRHSGHRMRKDNSFTFYALGERFAISPPDAQTWMEILHNLVMAGDVRRTRDAREYPYGAKFLATRQTEDFVYIASDASESIVYYREPTGWESPSKRKVKLARRQLLYGKRAAGIQQPYLLIVDDLEAQAGDETFSWLLQTAAQNEVVLEEGPDRYRIVGGERGAMLHVRFLAPQNLTLGTLSHNGLGEIKGRISDQELGRMLTTVSAETRAAAVRFVVLLVATEAEEPPPEIGYEGNRLTLRFADGTVDTIVVEDDDLQFVRASQEDLEEPYKATRLLGNHGNVSAWEKVNGLLRLNTSDWFGIEQHALTRTDISLAVGHEWRADLVGASSGAGDLGLYVGAGHPTAGARVDFLNIYVRNNVQLLSRGFAGTVELDLVNGGTAHTISSLFIARPADKVFELGWYDGDTRTVLATRTMPEVGIGSAVGFYADVRGAGTLEGLMNAELISSVSGYEAWADNYLPEGFRGPEEEAFGDGVANLLRYALLPPGAEARDFPPLPIADRKNGWYGFNIRSDVRYGVESSTDLRQWSEAVVEIRAAAEGFLHVVAPLDLVSRERAFFRLVINNQ
jgi:hypothetical protein